jgi:hypothetical protein
VIQRVHPRHDGGPVKAGGSGPIHAQIIVATVAAVEPAQRAVGVLARVVFPYAANDPFVIGRSAANSRPRLESTQALAIVRAPCDLFQRQPLAALPRPRIIVAV